MNITKYREVVNEAWLTLQDAFREARNQFEQRVDIATAKLLGDDPRQEKDKPMENAKR